MALLKTADYSFDFDSSFFTLVLFPRSHRQIRTCSPNRVVASQFLTLRLSNAMTPKKKILLSLAMVNSMFHYGEEKKKNETKVSVAGRSMRTLLYCHVRHHTHFPSVGVYRFPERNETFAILPPFCCYFTNAISKMCLHLWLEVAIFHTWFSIFSNEFLSRSDSVEAN